MAAMAVAGDVDPGEDCLLGSPPNRPRPGLAGDEEALGDGVPGTRRYGSRKRRGRGPRGVPGTPQLHEQVGRAVIGEKTYSSSPPTKALRAERDVALLTVPRRLDHMRGPAR